MESNTKKYFEKVKNNNQQISFNDLKKAENIATKLDKHTNDFLLIIKMIKDVLNGNFKLNPVDLTTMTALIIYVVSPIDAIPDFIPIVGLIDDISLIGFILVKYTHILEDYKNHISLGRVWYVCWNLYVPN